MRLLCDLVRDAKHAPQSDVRKEHWADGTVFRGHYARAPAVRCWGEVAAKISARGPRAASRPGGHDMA